MFDMKEFLAIAVPPKQLDRQWLEGAEGAVDFVVKNANSNEIILYTNVGQALIHAMLVPLANVNPPDGADLQRSYIDSFAQWTISHESGGGEPDRIYLADPLSNAGCKSLAGGEKLVFRRRFNDVDRGPVRTELSQSLVQALDLYFLEEENAYCCLDENGEVQPIIRIRVPLDDTQQKSAILVTMDAEQLHRYMAVTDSALLFKFDFTRFNPDSFFGWHNPTRDERDEVDLCSHSGVQLNASFAAGVYILRPFLTKEILIAKNNAKWDDTSKQYAVFKAHDWKNNRQAEISCAPWALASYFEKDSNLPFQVTPAFFRAEVLQKYKANPEKYKLEHRSISARGGWYLKSYDVNDAGQVHAYLYDLAKLPYSEQIYWLSFNEWPKAPISKRAFETDFEGNFSSIPDPLIDLKYELGKLDSSPPIWWKPRGEDAANVVHYPLTSSPEEWSNSILALDQLVVEGFVSKELRNIITDSGKAYDEKWGSLRLLQECIAVKVLANEEAIRIVEPLKQTHYLRNKLKGHLAESEKLSLIKKSRGQHGSLQNHFRNLVAEVNFSLDKIVEML